MINFNSDNAKLLNAFMVDGISYPVYTNEYECPCKKGVITYERVPGFDDDCATIECVDCAKKYNILYGRGHAWALIEK